MAGRRRRPSGHVAPRWGSDDYWSTFAPPALGFQLRGQLEDRSLLVLSADDLHREREAFPGEAGGIEAAGWPGMFQRILNGTEPVSQSRVTVAPHPSMMPVGTARADITAVNAIP